ncbi:biotin-dependent carboxyltransferase family protein [Acetobacter sacchari]|uniref:Biotin-dependent carboxyltransferase family protein n=1 Tax=Acetobacter sacchari TaxID=2661687 RepID=A0ABS3LSB3_9PROT|nr:biotin-dependent carboxyltransferase family protein [Acetobacter sacchari]MBO1358785.1 biotin-dependent carboxyltransferase family protein [Acetobacter sacchari]
MIEVLTGSPLNTIQDLGRPRTMTLGVSRGGAMDSAALKLGNLLLGNDIDAAGIEVVFFPFKVRFHADQAFAVTGARGVARLDDEPLPPDWAAKARAGQILTLHAPANGARSYVTFAGGLDVPVVLGSRSTDMKGGFGGYQGRALEAGTRLAAFPSDAKDMPSSGYGLAHPCDLPENVAEVRCLPAAEFDAFTDDSQALFFEQLWTVTRTANRLGYRLESETPLSLRSPLELLSHGIVPGTIQVPSAGMPIVQMADANTCGGYPKIANVIEPDLRLLAQTQTGRQIRFIRVELDEAVAAVRADAIRMHELGLALQSARATLLAR